MLIAATLFLLLSTPAEADAPCRQETVTTFVLEGPVNDEMAECAETTLADSTTELIVDSGGGDLGAAFEIAERLEPLALTIRVRNRCYSSCANYFLPMADRLIVEPGATIVLHGGADPLLLEDEFTDDRERRLREIRRDNPAFTRAEVEARYQQALQNVRSLIERQRAFADRHNVGPGWFLYRERPGDFGSYLTGEAGDRPQLFRWQYLLAEEPMIRSCLPGVEIEPFQQQLEQHFIDNEDRYRRFSRAGGRRSLHLRCTTAN